MYGWGKVGGDTGNFFRRGKGMAPFGPSLKSKKIEDLSDQGWQQSKTERNQGTHITVLQQLSSIIQQRTKVNTSCPYEICLHKADRIVRLLS